LDRRNAQPYTHTNTNTNGNCYTHCNCNCNSNRNGYSNSHGNRDPNSHGDGYGYTDRNRDTDCDAYSDGDCNFDGNAYSDAAGCHNQCSNETREFFCNAQWLSQSAWVEHDGLFSVGHDNQLRTHHSCADSDWEYFSAYHCQHQRLECEPPLSLSNCSHQQWRHELWQRQDIYDP
jgi:hypothetical protein